MRPEGKMRPDHGGVRVTVSVITVARNASEFIEDTIRSVAEQTYPEIEYIVIDGASTDGTVDVIRRNSSVIAKWISEPDTGIADAFNKGLSLSTGAYVMFLNSDDRLSTPDVIQDMVKAIDRTGLPDLIYGDFEIRDRLTDERKYDGSIAFERKQFLRGRVLPHPCLLTNRRYFERFGAFDTHFRIAMDYEWMLRGALEARVVHVPYRTTTIRDGGISSNNPGTVGEIIAALRKNGYLQSRIGSYQLRLYFWLRSVVRRALERTGLAKSTGRWRRERGRRQHPRLVG